MPALEQNHWDRPTAISRNCQEGYRRTARNYGEGKMVHGYETDWHIHYILEEFDDSI